MLTKLFNWLQGYLLVRMVGRSPERFINLCSNRGIPIWNLKNRKGFYEFHMMSKDYMSLKPIVKKTGTIPRILGKYGYPFFRKKYKKRRAFFLGILLCGITLHMLSLFVWDIHFIGGHTYTSEAMVKFLKEKDIYVGLQKKEVNCQEIEELIRGTYKDIGWVSAEMKGTRLIIKITETSMPSPAVIGTVPVHLIASKDAIVDRIVTRVGTPMVREGTIVKKGDILVSGVVEIIGDNAVVLEKKSVVSDADIIGKTFYEYEDNFSLDYLKKFYTNEVKKGYCISIGLRKINLYKPRIQYTKYDIITNENKIHLSNNFYLPISVISSTYVEFTEIQQKYTNEQALEVAGLKLERYIKELEKQGVIIIDNMVTFVVEKNQCVAKGKIIVYESIKDFRTINENEWRIIETDESSGNNN